MTTLKTTEQERQQQEEFLQVYARENTPNANATFCLRPLSDFRALQEQLARADAALVWSWPEHTEPREHTDDQAMIDYVVEVAYPRHASRQRAAKEVQ